MFGALISGHKFSDPEFCKNKIVSSCTLTFEITCLAAFVHIWALETKAGNWGICSCRLHGGGHYLFPINPFSLDFQICPWLLIITMRKSQFILERKDIVTSTAAFIVNGIGHIYDVLLLWWVLINRGQFNKAFTSQCNHCSRSEHNSYTCKSFIKLTPGTCFSLCTLQH